MYYEFATDALKGYTGANSVYNYDYTDNGTGRLTSAEELQDAIWILQGQTVYTKTGSVLAGSSDPY